MISCFEVALRNRIDHTYRESHGNDWIRTSIGGVFAGDKCRNTRKKIEDKINTLGEKCSHDKLVAEMEFGFWRYLFAPTQFWTAGSILLNIFPCRPRSSNSIKYNHSYVFEELQKINNLRNRIAHHEAICFTADASKISTDYVRIRYQIILTLFHWMDIDEKSLMHGLDHVITVCNEIDSLSLKSTSLPSSQ